MMALEDSDMNISPTPPGEVPPVLSLPRETAMCPPTTAVLRRLPVCSRQPKLAVLGALITGCGPARMLGGEIEGVHLAAQAGVIFFLLHSLRWDEVCSPSESGWRSRDIAGICRIRAILNQHENANSH
jgi:hypothetical protein